MTAHSNIVTKHNCAFPDFVERRINTWLERYNKLWGGNHLLHGRVPDANAIHLFSNDYLCLSGEREIVEAQVSTLMNDKDFLMSAVFLHGDNPQNRLERKMAAYLKSEDGVVFQSGWAANVGLIQTLAGPDIPVYLDTMAHASLWEGANMARATPIPFRHNDVEYLEKQIRVHGPDIVAVDSVYSTNGSMCPLLDILGVTENAGSIIIVDESHSIGTHGPKGAGVVVALNLQERVHFRTASLAKAFAGRAGFITCSTYFKSYFMCESRPAIFSSCLLNHELEWFNTAVDAIQTMDDRRIRLMETSRHLRIGLNALGYNVNDGSEQIIALEAGPEPQTMVLRNALQAMGIFGAVFCAPATPKNRSLIRLTINSGLSDVEIERVLFVCGEIRDQVNLRDWPSTRRLQRKATSSKHGSKMQFAS
jgi:CAI-1 autoinducer synthase